MNVFKPPYTRMGPPSEIDEVKSVFSVEWNDTHEIAIFSHS